MTEGDGDMNATKASGKSGSDFEEWRAAVEREQTLAGKMRLSQDCLEHGALARSEMGFVHGCMGASHFELAYDPLLAARAGRSAHVDAVQVERDLRLAVQHYTSAIGLNPGQYVDPWNRGYCFELLGDLSAAHKDYTQSVTIDPGFAKGSLYRARIRERQGDLASATADIRQAHRVDPTAPEVRDAMARHGLDPNGV
jgi:tetratricopeptide (TPR) repeat protein